MKSVIFDFCIISRKLDQGWGSVFFLFSLEHDSFSGFIYLVHDRAIKWKKKLKSNYLFFHNELRALKSKAIVITSDENNFKRRNTAQELNVLFAHISHQEFHRWGEMCIILSKKSTTKTCSVRRNCCYCVTPWPIDDSSYYYSSRFLYFFYSTLLLKIVRKRNRHRHGKYICNNNNTTVTAHSA